MWLIKQTVEHDPDNGKIGNCFSASLSSLLHLPIESIPTFTGPDWTKAVNEFLEPYGLAYVTILTNPAMMTDMGIKGLHHEAEVPSLHPQAQAHSCVAIDGEVMFDPGATTREHYEVLSYGLFVVLRPWTHMSRSKP